MPSHIYSAGNQELAGTGAETIARCGTRSRPPQSAGDAMQMKVLQEAEQGGVGPGAETN